MHTILFLGSKKGWFESLLVKNETRVKDLSVLRLFCMSHCFFQLRGSGVGRVLCLLHCTGDRHIVTGVSHIVPQGTGNIELFSAKKNKGSENPGFHGSRTQWP